MDEFGYGAALTMALTIYENSQRGTGRTKSIIDRVQPGDVIVCRDVTDARVIRNRLEDAGKLLEPNAVQLVVSSPEIEAAMHDLRTQLKSRDGGRVHLSEQWVFGYHSHWLQQTVKDLDVFERSILARPTPADAHRAPINAVRGVRFDD